MRQILVFFIVIAFCSCKQKNEQTRTTQSNVSADSISKSSIERSTEKTENKRTKLTTLEWENYEDSLRNQILKHKENETLKESFLQEMYIRNVAKISKDSLLVTIPFDLHGPDCGAPDCYSTDVSFNFKLGNILVFPKDLQFQEYKHGCVDKEEKLNGSFQLIEQTAKHVIYHSSKYRRTMVFFSSKNENGTTAYYFTEVGQNTINGKNVYSIVKDYNEENKNSIYPFTSWILTTNEYENFLSK